MAVPRARDLDCFQGAIAAGAFASGDQVVVGMWGRSPLGSFVDVMWVRPDGERVLLAPNRTVRDFVGDVYAFDREEVVAVRGGWDGSHVEVVAGPLRVRLVPAPRDWRSWVFALRPRPLRRSPAWLGVEDRLVGPLGGLLLGGASGVRVSGLTPGGRREWYSTDDYRRVVRGTLEIAGRDAGARPGCAPPVGGDRRGDRYLCLRNNDVIVIEQRYSAGVSAGSGQEVGAGERGSSDQPVPAGPRRG